MHYDNFSLRQFLITPYDNTFHGTPEDTFNFSPFGEIDLRWGILWRWLQFSLKMNCKVIDACMRLHNFIFDSREEHLSQSDSSDDSLA